MKSTFKVLFFLKRNAQRKDGCMPIIARITIDGKVAQFNTKLEVAPSFWSVTQGKALGRTAEVVQLNGMLDSIRASVYNHYHTLQERDSHITSEKIKNAFLGINETHTTILEIFTKHNAETKKLVGINKSYCTYKKYELSMRRVQEFLRCCYNISDIALRDITLSFIRDYELFLPTNCALSNNVAAKMIQYLKKMVTLARNTGIIHADPFVNYHIKVNRVDRGYLDQHEMIAIMQKKITLKRLEQVRDVFIFSCFTGLSFVDVRNLKSTHIRENFDGNIWIMTKRQKTDNPVNIRLLDVPKRIVEKYHGKLPFDAILPTMSNQKMNCYLKELADICGIIKNLTFHMARHTFATTTTLANGVPIETVSKMLGHTNIKTTQIYARITDHKLSNDMDMLSGKLSAFQQDYK